jgi:hypothetical protein
MMAGKRGRPRQTLLRRGQQQPTIFPAQRKHEKLPGLTTPQAVKDARVDALAIKVSAGIQLQVLANPRRLDLAGSNAEDGLRQFAQWAAGPMLICQQDA